VSPAPMRAPTASWRSVYSIWAPFLCGAYAQRTLWHPDASAHVLHRVIFGHSHLSLESGWRQSSRRASADLREHLRRAYGNSGPALSGVGEINANYYGPVLKQLQFGLLSTCSIIAVASSAKASAIPYNPTPTGTLHTESPALS
jgi:hypothetical protein